jgi:hypothetical protein
MRHQIRDHHAALSTRTNRSHGLEGEELIRADLRDFFAQGRVDLLPVVALNEGLWVKEIHLRRSTAHEQKDDTLGFRHHAGDASRERIRGRTGDVLQSESTEAAGGALEELAASKRVHGGVEKWSFEMQ